MDITIHSGIRDDLKRLTDIYNYYVSHSHVTFDTEIFSLIKRESWFKKFSNPGVYKLYVAKKDAHVVGYATSSQYRPKPAYYTSVETTVYVSPDSTGRGVGGALYEFLLNQISKARVHRAYAIITLPNEASVHLHRRFDFRELAVLSEVGDKFGKFWDTLWMERKF